MIHEMHSLDPVRKCLDVHILHVVGIEKQQVCFPLSCRRQYITAFDGYESRSRRHQHFTNLGKKVVLQRLIDQIEMDNCHAAQAFG